MNKKQYIGDLRTGDVVDSQFLLIDKQAVKQYKNGFMFRARISDRTGAVQAIYFGDRDEDQTVAAWSPLKVGQLVSIKGIRGEYNGAPQVTISPSSGHIKREYGPYDKDDYVRESDRDLEEMRHELVGIIGEIGDPDIRALLKGFFADDVFLEEFSTAPAAVTMHHSYRGGLLEHVLGMIRISVAVAEIHRDLDADYLIAGCILHDIGKLRTYAQEGLAIVRTDDGNLIGHIAIGYQMVSDMMARTNPEMPYEKRQKILHMILSHHGRLEWGSPIVPAFPEADALHLVDSLDAKIKGALQRRTDGLPQTR